MAALPIYHYGRSIRRATYQLLDLFNEYVIHRYDASGVSTQVLNVPIKFGPADNLFWEVEEDDKGDASVNENPLHPILTLPRMGLSFDGLSPGTTPRATLKTHPVWYVSGADPDAGFVKSYIPISVNMGYNLALATKSIDDQLQLMEQVYEVFYPLCFIEMPLNELGYGNFARWPVKLVNTTGPRLETTTNENPWFRTDFTLNVRGWIYKMAEASGSQIYEVTTNLYTRYWGETDATGASAWVDTGDSLNVSAVPSAISALSGVTDITIKDENYVLAVSAYMMSGTEPSAADYS